MRGTLCGVVISTFDLSLVVSFSTKLMICSHKTHSGVSNDASEIEAIIHYHFCAII